MKSELRRIAGQLEIMVYSSPNYSNEEIKEIRKVLQLIKNREDNRMSQLPHK